MGEGTVELDVHPELFVSGTSDDRPIELAGAVSADGSQVLLAWSGRTWGDESSGTLAKMIVVGCRSP